jgi:hypothetical protein
MLQAVTTISRQIGTTFFILAVNSAFEALRGVKGLPSELRKASDDDPLFHQNDPMAIKGIHNEKESFRKPDVVLVSMG